ncbi:MAG: penicillin acylase family protein, partial [Kordiimonadaceae bacterium]|nr:penicillin acylase family protein [Kordiimonadaceae bacterium]
MRRFFIVVLIMFGHQVQAQETFNVVADGLRQPVEIIKDKWGVSHIYAQNQADLFFAQGYNAASDRLFQFEIWRRKATGTLSEIMGEKALAHDKGARLLRFRGDLEAELAHYHEDSKEIITSFVAGVNAFIDETSQNPELLSFEFYLLGIKPGYWTPEIVISRHNALTGGISNEIMLSKTITAIGSEKTRKILPFSRDTHLEPFEGIDLSKITDDIMAGYRASRSQPQFDASDLKNPTMASALNQSLVMDDEHFWTDPIEGVNNIGSNNWIISGSKTKSGKPMMANDPHRTIQSPSLRYMVHLNAPATD